VFVANGTSTAFVTTTTIRKSIMLVSDRLAFGERRPVRAKSVVTNFGLQ
jgi:hypothetical protein